jgi:hypothetical protein
MSPAFVLVWLIMTGIAGYIGHIKNRLVLGLVLGFLIGIFGIFVIAILPAKAGSDTPGSPG